MPFKAAECNFTFELFCFFFCFFFHNVLLNRIFLFGFNFGRLKGALRLKSVKRTSNRVQRVRYESELWRFVSIVHVQVALKIKRCEHPQRKEDHRTTLLSASSKENFRTIRVMWSDALLLVWNDILVALTAPIKL